MRPTPLGLSNSGISTLFVISSMFFTMFLGTTMLKMVTSGHLGRANFTSTESARQTAKSGTTAAIHFMERAENNPSTLAMLQMWVDAEVDGPMEFLSGSLSDGASNNYNVDLIAFDHTNFNVTIKSAGLGKGSSRSRMTSVYHLEGLEFEPTNFPGIGNVPQCALQIDNGNYEFNCELQIDGNTQVFEKMIANNGPFLFNGDFRLDPHRITGNRPTTVFNKGVTIMGNAYFGCPVSCYGTDPLVLHGKTAFEDKTTYRGDKISVLGTDIYFNDDVMLEGTGATDVNSANVNYVTSNTFHEQIWTSPAITAESFFTTTGEFKPSATPFTALRDSVEVFDPEPKIDFNYTYVLENAPNIITVPSEYTVSNTDLDSWYAEQLSNEKLFHDKFLVIHYPSTYTNSRGIPMDARLSRFDGKAIIIVEAPQFDIISLETTDNANVALYLHSVSTFDPKLKDMGNFRGFIYMNEVTSSGHITFYLRKAKSGIYRGAIYAGENARTKFDGGTKKHHIIYDPLVLNELAEAGIFSNETTESDQPERTTTLRLKATHEHINAKLVSQSL